MVGALQTGRAGRVLVLDDDPAMRRVLARVLRWRDYAPVLAASAAEALAALDGAPFVAMTIDQDLGFGQSGLDFARQVHARLGTRTPALILVSASVAELPEAGRELFAAIHCKPFHALALLDELDRLVGRAKDQMGSGVRRRLAKTRPRHVHRPLGRRRLGGRRR
ncbi:MAG: response regulator [Sandaracinaceae bacterium]